MTCLCPSDVDGRRLTVHPWQAPARPGCPQHPPTEICPATHRLWRSSTTGQPIPTPCNTRLDGGGECPDADRHAQPHR